MIKVLQIGMCDTLGGIESYLINYQRNIDKNKIHFDYINMTNGDLCFQDELLKYGSNIHKVYDYKKNPIKYIKELRKIIIENEYDIVHYNMNSAVFLYPLIASKLAKVKTIVAHSHNSSNDKGFLKGLIHNINKHFIPLFANTYFACSEIAGKWFFSSSIINSKKYFIINNAINQEKYTYDDIIRKEKRRELGIDENTLVIGHVGRFYKQKNHEFLINVFEKVVNENKNIKLLLVGTGPLQDRIKKIVKERNIENKVIFIGQTNDVNKLYQAFDIFLLPSIYEGLPLVGVEAQCSGCNCIFSDNITKELKLTKNCKFLPIDNCDQWKNEILKFNKDSNRNKLEIPSYDIKLNAQKLLEIYEYSVYNGRKYGSKK